MREPVKFTKGEHLSAEKMNKLAQQAAISGVRVGGISIAGLELTRLLGSGGRGDNFIVGEFTGTWPAFAAGDPGELSAFVTIIKGTAPSGIVGWLNYSNVVVDSCRFLAVQIGNDMVLVAVFC